MSDDERSRKRKEHEDGEPDVEAHIFDGDDLGEPDPEKKRKLGDFDVEDGEDLKAHGNIVDHEYEIKRDGDVVATVSKKWFRVRDTYGVEIGGGEDVALVLALTVALDEMSGD